MNHEEPAFQELLASQMKDRGISIKKLSEATGIAPAHIEKMLRGDFDQLPSAPYVRGYLLRIGKTLGFDGEEWWKRLRGDEAVRNSGPSDALPQNRFMKKDAPKWLWFAIAAGILVALYLVIALPHILGKPSLTLTYPSANPYTLASTSITFAGVVRNADALYLSNGAGASSSEEVAVAPDGSWEKSALLGPGLNTFQFEAKKFLGAETDLTVEVISESIATGTGTLPASDTAPGTTQGF